MNRLRKDTQKPELDDLRLEVSYICTRDCDVLAARGNEVGNHAKRRHVRNRSSHNDNSDLIAESGPSRIPNRRSEVPAKPQQD